MGRCSCSSSITARRTPWNFSQSSRATWAWRCSGAAAQSRRRTRRSTTSSRATTAGSGSRRCCRNIGNGGRCCAATLFGSNTGKVYRWTPGAGYVAEPGSDMPFPNGIEKAPDEDALYVASTLGNDVRRLDLARGEVTARAAIEGPDNLTWSADGRLLVASHADSWLEMMALPRPRTRWLRRGVRDRHARPEVDDSVRHARAPRRTDRRRVCRGAGPRQFVSRRDRR